MIIIWDRAEKKHTFKGKREGSQKGCLSKTEGFSLLS